MLLQSGHTYLLQGALQHMDSTTLSYFRKGYHIFAKEDAKHQNKEDVILVLFQQQKSGYFISIGDRLAITEEKEQALERRLPDAPVKTFDQAEQQDCVHLLAEIQEEIGGEDFSDEDYKKSCEIGPLTEEDLALLSKDLLAFFNSMATRKFYRNAVKRREEANSALAAYNREVNHDLKVLEGRITGHFSKKKPNSKDIKDNLPAFGRRNNSGDASLKL